MRSKVHADYLYPRSPPVNLHRQDLTPERAARWALASARALAGSPWLRCLSSHPRRQPSCTSTAALGCVALLLALGFGTGVGGVLTSERAGAVTGAEAIMEWSWCWT